MYNFNKYNSLNNNVYTEELIVSLLCGMLLWNVNNLKIVRTFKMSEPIFPKYGLDHYGFKNLGLFETISGNNKRLYE